MVPETKQAEHAGGFRTPLAEKIFLDRYALKSMDKEAIDEGTRPRGSSPVGRPGVSTRKNSLESEPQP